MDDAPALAPLIRRLRGSARLTQEELAESAGISVRTVSDIERGLRRFVYRDTAERLATALAVEPAERTDFVAIARGRSRRIDSASEPVATSFIVPAVPSPPTRLIGREREVEAVVDAFRGGSTRSLTLSGPGGIGKTRIAIEASARAQGIFRDGVFFLALASTDSATGVMASLGRALGIGDVEDPTLVEIAQHLRAAKVLVILDTFEHLLPAAPYVGELLSMCDGLTVLATSREPLHIRGEHVLPVAPLELPASGALDLAANPSTALFVERARAVRPDLDLGEGSAAAVADICRRVSGLPLAIELAASRVQHVSLVTLRDQLDSGLGLLSRGPADVPPRQRTMRGTIAWSYELLDPTEQSLFRAVSVFVGGWSLEAADHIWRATTPGRDTLATMSALVDKSLAVADPGGSEARFTMLEVIAEFAVEQREKHLESAALHQAHASFFLALAERAEVEMGGSEQDAWCRRLALDHDNLRSALRRAAVLGDSELEIRLAGALWQFWRAEDHYAEGRTWIEDALRRDSNASVDARAKAMWGAAWLAFHQDDLRAARRFSEQLIALTQSRERSIERRNALTVEAMLHLAEGRFEAAVLPLRESVLICESIGPSWLLATSRLNLALACMHTGRLEEASLLLEAASDLYLKLGDERFVTRALVCLAHLRLLQANRTGANELFRDALGRSWALQDQNGIAEALEGLAAVNAAGGAMERAAWLWGRATRLREESTSRTLPFERALIERWLDEAKSSLGDEGWDAAIAQGRGLDLASCVNEEGDLLLRRAPR